MAEEMGIKILKVNTDLDHVHLLVSCKPQHYISTIVKYLTSLIFILRYLLVKYFINYI
ncbi:MAG: transposase [Bacilli bacterium]|nr:transposase [Bacilli bacterium]